MNETEISHLDKVYISYGYETTKAYPGVRVYLFTKSIYSGADVVKLDSSGDAEALKKKYSALGYGVKVRDFNSVSEAEDILFKDFFKADGVIDNLKRRYKNFVGRIMENLPETAKYQYIKSPYEFSIINEEHEEQSSLHFSADDPNDNLTDKIVGLINKHNGPLLTIIEAAAGFGKTCTAYEILNSFISTSINKIPFFTELSRDRRATIFKHILQNEIEEQFSNRVDSKVVINEIKQGRIPLIIDGFDELISKDFSFSTSRFEEVESMLSTIVDLLTDNAKIIITSRKTAIFSSEEFHNWMIDRNIPYTLAKISLTEPSIENWLSKDKLELIDRSSFPVNKIANPVLLTYLRYIDFSELSTMIFENESIVQKYFEFLLTREQIRQNLVLEPEIQLRIFRKLVRLMTELDIKTETKDFIKELIQEYNSKVLEETRKNYTPDKRPRIDQLADTLSNHAFLDRKEKNLIGFVNEFVFGTLIGENLIMGKFSEHNPKFYESLNQMFALLALEAFKVQSEQYKKELWQIFFDYNFRYEAEFFFKLDIDLLGVIVRDYKHAILDGFELKDMLIQKEGQFSETVFNNCVFYNCNFNFKSFSNCSFVNCRFYDCQFDTKTSYSDSYFVAFGCTDNNDLISQVFDIDIPSKVQDVNLEKSVLSLFFKTGGLSPRYRQLSFIKSELSKEDQKEISKILHKLKAEDLIYFKGDLSHLTKKGIVYYNENYRTELV